MEWNEMTSHPIIYRSTLCKLISYVTWARCDMHNLAINFNNVINTLLIKKIQAPYHCVDSISRNKEQEHFMKLYIWKHESMESISDTLWTDLSE